MERKYQSYIREWRLKAGLTQQQLADRLAVLAGEPKPNDKALNIPTTTASLSRIENGEQNWNAATLYALAEILGAENPGWLIDRNPLKEGKVVSLDDRLNQLDDERRARAEAVIEVLLANGG